jgi:hypothetical protein
MYLFTGYTPKKKRICIQESEISGRTFQDNTCAEYRKWIMAVMLHNMDGTTTV